MSTSRPPSRSRTNPPSRPTTPLRPSSRSSFRSSTSQNPTSSTLSSPLETLEPAFAEFSDALADLEANMMHLQIMHESLSRFSESFASFLYGLNMNAFCVDFPEAPSLESFKRVRVMEERSERIGLASQQTAGLGGTGMGGGMAVDNTFLTTDTSFVEHPSTVKSSQKYMTPAPKSRAPAKTPPPPPSGIARGTTGRGRGGVSGIARGVGRGRASGIARGTRGGRTKGT